MNNYRKNNVIFDFIKWDLHDNIPFGTLYFHVAANTFYVQGHEGITISHNMNNNHSQSFIKDEQVQIVSIRLFYVPIKSTTLSLHEIINRSLNYFWEMYKNERQTDNFPLYLGTFDYYDKNLRIVKESPQENQNISVNAGVGGQHPSLKETEQQNYDMRRIPSIEESLMHIGDLLERILNCMKGKKEYDI